ncbi:hypothetical protein I6A84_29600 [Frankia sp. CNm7]|uniref:Uncharacterized protein n=1 Tax=Frankia nepalensis TaxID=1836974 RepID=A0A937UPI3_9ACTN|nr:hypothetical protein [Frankia nepalensis]MBL7498542.1 hypothetical protein [Frankia nepalensis]MBL7516185.1 hypothetical protein [Frankia nepalensis]MBL7522120.1 hypothetical protein [Frankia nepalensis]MBL7630899.1 hypothetical protein [Frankia nepalensis]
MSGVKPSARGGGRPGDRLTGSQVGFLLALMAAGAAVSNPELVARYRLSLDGADRRRLGELGLVTSRRAGRSYVHELTDAGWARCRRELSAPVPEERVVIPVGAVYALLAGLGRHLDRAGLGLADVFSPALATPERGGPGLAGDPTPVAGHDGPRPTDTSGPTGSGHPRGSGDPRGNGDPRNADGPTDGDDPGADEAERRIRIAYGTLARWPGDWVRLADLRPRVGTDVGRADVDEALRRMNRARGVTVAPDEDQKGLTGADRREAVEIGGQPKHLIMIEG